MNIHKPWAAEFPLVAAVVTTTTGLIRLRQHKCFKKFILVIILITIDVRLLEQSCLADVACQRHTSPTLTSPHCVPQLRYKVPRPRTAFWYRSSIVRKSYRRVKDKNIICEKKIRQDLTLTQSTKVMLMFLSFLCTIVKRQVR